MYLKKLFLEDCNPKGCHQTRIYGVNEGEGVKINLFVVIFQIVLYKMETVLKPIISFKPLKNFKYFKTNTLQNLCQPLEV